MAAAAPRALPLLLCSALLGAGEALPVRAVTLSTSGVGWFEHAATIDGEAEAELRFRARQINDVLKSLVLQDLGGGTISAVSYPSQEPLERRLRSFQVDISGNPSLPELLNQLRGARVAVNVGDASLEGVILGCEARQRVSGDQSETQWFLNLLVEGAIRPLPVAELRQLRPLDERLREELAKALAALASARDQERTPLRLRFSGQGKRLVRVGYVVEAPVWKASYRLLLKDGGAAHLQGWAIVENTTESDWQEVRLTLASGRPISFVMDLYQPLYIERPVVELPRQAGVRPLAHEGGVAPPQSPEMAPPKAAARRERKAEAAVAMAATAERQLAAEPAFDAAASVPIATTATQDLGEVFAYEIARATVPRQGSAMIPFVGVDLPAERLAIYRRSVHARHPLAGVRISNRSGSHLAPGPVTVYDSGVYVGEAQLTALPPGQQRQLSYALEQRVIVDSERSSERLLRSLLRLVKGLAEARCEQRRARVYQISNQGPQPRRVVIEHPRAGGEWELAETPPPLEQTAELYRFEIEVPAQGSRELRVTESRRYHESLALLDGEEDRIALFLDGYELPPRLREALLKARDLAEAWRALQRQRQELASEMRAIGDDQERIRRNLGAVDRGSEYARRLHAKLSEQETRLEELRARDERLAAEARAARQRLADYLAQLSIE
ncbi:MAG: hypothetical protein NZ552_05545 [Planctomycetes bacterium]|nr:hypothetical protein [Planctomycetota bacterium]